jgi:hypothetical protein
LKDSRDHIGGQMSRVDRVFENVKARPAHNMPRGA